MSCHEVCRCHEPRLTSPLSLVLAISYFTAASVAEKYEIYWANQTLRTSFASDGRLYGDLETVTINCDTGANTCAIPLKAPSMAIVFLTDAAVAASTADEQAPTATFATSVINVGSATVDIGSIQTGNGQAGGGVVLGSNSKGGLNAGERNMAMGWWAGLSGLGLSLLATLA